MNDRARALADSGPPRVLIAESVLSVTEKLLIDQGGRGAHERIVYWAGVESENTWLVTTAIRPESRTTWGSFQTSAKANAEVTLFLSRSNLQLLAQVHTHANAFVDHSDGDDTMVVVAFQNFLSIVVPHYGTKGMRPLSQCGIHRFEEGVFRRLTPTEIDVAMRVLPGMQDFEGT